MKAVSKSCFVKQASDSGAKDGHQATIPKFASCCNLRQRRLGKTVLLMLFLLTLTILQPYFYLSILSWTRTSSLRRSITNEGRLEVNNTNNSTTSIVKEVIALPPSQPSIISVNSSHAPLFYHISPGSTGSRTLYHAACNSGFPSVHHKSFCISSTRGVNGVSPRVVDGVRAHLQVLRLYQIAYKCCSYWRKGIIMQDDNSDDGKITVMKGEGEEDDIILELCDMSLDDWAKDIQTHLSTVLQSSIVGLFDTPYPLLASQVLDLAMKLRTIPPIVAMTERDVSSWARSRSQNHNLMLCKKEFSYEGWGSSEFDILGCVERASAAIKAREEGKDTVLYFWDVFEYRSRSGEADDSEFREGLEVQMEHHQRVYRPIANYTPNFFGSLAVNESHSATTPTKKVTVTDKQVADEIQRLILLRKDERVPSESVNINGIQTKVLSWKADYKKPLTCRGAVQYDFLSDTFTELYDHPKTCDKSVGAEIDLI